MTVIVYSQGIIAADSMVTQGDLCTGFTRKITRNAKGDLAGASGGAGWMRDFLLWFEEGEQGEMPSLSYADADATDAAMIIRATDPGKAWHLCSNPKYAANWYTVNQLNGCAIGSGKAEAKGALFAGADAITAVKAAIALDNSCGGDIIAIPHAGPERLIVAPKWADEK